MRSLSAVDIALWDILGQQSGQPIWQLLGGSSHPDGPLVYNTCASAGYAGRRHLRGMLKRSSIRSAN
jgi:L-alanine-DL-glutamate epimerase-like enolase superfamily enzyme